MIPRPKQAGQVADPWRIRAALLAMLLLLSGLASGCRYPEDVNGSLDRIRGGVMNVGLSENPPWVIRTAAGPSGVEPEIIRALAKGLDARVQWHWGSESELIRALKAHQLDLVASGLVQQSPIVKQITVSKPYFQSRFTVGFPAHSVALPRTLEGIEIQVAAISPLADLLRDQGAIADVKARPDPIAPIAAPTWWLQAHNLQPGPWELITEKQVIALPPGENAWILVVQKHLDQYLELDRLVKQMAAGNEY